MAAPLKEEEFSTVNLARQHDKLSHDSYYYTIFWASLKGFGKGLLGGLILGAALGAIIGLGAAGAAAIAVALGAEALTLSGAALVGYCAAGVGAIGMFAGAHEMSVIGGNAGVGVALDEMEIRQNGVRNAKDKNLLKSFAYMLGKEEKLPDVLEYHNALNVKSEFDRRNTGNVQSSTPHMDAATAPTKKLFHWKVGLAGLLVGLGVGALILAAAPAMTALPFLGALASHGAAHLVGGAAISAFLTTTALFGASFGVDRMVLRRTFDKIIDPAYSGDLFQIVKKEPIAPSLSPQITNVIQRTESKGIDNRTRVTAEEAAVLEARLGQGREMPDRFRQIEAAKRQLATMNPNEVIMQ